MRSSYLAIFLLFNYASALIGKANYVAPSNSTRVLRQTESSDSGKNLDDVLAQRKDESEDVGPLGEVQLDVEEEDIGEAAEPKMRVRRGYSGGGGGSQQKSKYGGGQSNKYGGGGGSKYGGQQQQQQQQNQGGYGQQSSGGKYGGGGQSQGGSSGGYY